MTQKYILQAAAFLITIATIAKILLHVNSPISTVNNTQEQYTGSISPQEYQRKVAQRGKGIHGNNTESVLIISVDTRDLKEYQQGVDMDHAQCNSC